MIDLTRYAEFILPAYGITALVLIALVVEGLWTYRARQRELRRLEDQGIRRRSQEQEDG